MQLINFLAKKNKVKKIRGLKKFNPNFIIKKNSTLIKTQQKINKKYRHFPLIKKKIARHTNRKKFKKYFFINSHQKINFKKKNTKLGHSLSQTTIKNFSNLFFFKNTINLYNVKNTFLNFKKTKKPKNWKITKIFRKTNKKFSQLRKLHALKPIFQNTNNLNNFSLQLFKFITQKQHLLKTFSVLESQINILLYRMKFIPNLKLLPKIFFYNLVFLNNKIIRNPFLIINLFELIQVPYILTKKFYFYSLNNSTVKLKASKQKKLFYFLKLLKNLYTPYLNKIWLPTYFTTNIIVASGFLHAQPSLEYFTNPLVKFTKAFKDPLHKRRLPTLLQLSKKNFKHFAYKLKKIGRKRRHLRTFTTQYCLVKLDFFNFLDYYDNKY